MNIELSRVCMRSLVPAALVSLSAACVDGSGSDPIAALAPALESPEASGTDTSSAVLRDANGESIGRISFACIGDNTLVSVTAHLGVEDAGIRGIHIHANDDPPVMMLALLMMIVVLVAGAIMRQMD